MSTPMKPFLSLDDQLARIKGRGMTVDDADEARRWLAAVGYYRLSGYWYPFRVRDPATLVRSDRFLTDSSFTEVIGLYEFDRHLKTLILSGMERVEVAMRSQIGYTLGAYDPQAYRNSALFRSTFNHDGWNHTADGRVARARGRDNFVDHHDVKYGGQLPIWVLTDVLDFADISKLFEGMRATDQRRISDWFGITRDPGISNNQKKKWNSRPPLANWLEHLTVVRNICAHHGRLWNRQLTPVGTRVITHLPGFEGIPPDQAEHVYMTICIIAFLLDTTSPGNTWLQKVGTLVHRSFSRFEHRTVEEMGFPNNWAALAQWSGKTS
ncbi:Abi family protein [Williamsia sp. CHRR-6]|uniref:Abi family protein n=1 Tax=Williamsia sp. CHRR-6 TaxID=2835871 RepID=UPI001BDAB239|nr:Abi family protein [Williamsia sp. CHRR-6]MBT0566891.1 Abi family protein [Williamsia sp. CHRR-6]